jgi:uncharacterized protein YlbG (UPF0298 family)
MDTPKQLATLGTQDTTQKTKTMSNTDLTKNWKRVKKVSLIKKIRISLFSLKQKEFEDIKGR